MYLVVRGQKSGFLTRFSRASLRVLCSWPMDGLGLANLDYRERDQWHSVYTTGSEDSVIQDSVINSRRSSWTYPGTTEVFRVC